MPVVGDWDGDGIDNLGVFRDGYWYLDTGPIGYSGETPMRWGVIPGDMPVAGDWDGDGRDEMGIVRYNRSRGGLDWYLREENRNGADRRVMHYGLQGDTPVVGDWNQDGTDDMGVVREIAAVDYFYLDLAGNGDFAEEIIQYGLAGDVPLVGNWTAKR